MRSTIRQCLNNIVGRKFLLSGLLAGFISEVYICCCCSVLFGERGRFVFQ